MASTLKLRVDGGGPRYYVGNHPVHAGDTLELYLGKDHWLPVRFEMDGEDPIFYLGLGDTEDAATLRVPEAAIFRWPKRG